MTETCRIAPHASVMPVQASDQSKIESRVSWSEVANSCGVGLRLGRILTCSVRLTSAPDETVDGATEVKYTQRQVKKGLFINKTIVLTHSGRVGHSTHTFSGSAE